MSDYALVQLRYRRVRPSGQPAEDVAVNTLHFQASDGGLTSGDVDIVDGAWIDFWTAINNGVSQDMHIDDRRYYNLPATTGPVGDPAFTRTTDLHGNSSGDTMLPPQVACSITLKTAIRRRWGRIYVPGMLSNFNFNGRVAASALTEIGDAFDDFGTTMRDAGLGIVVWHRASWTPQDVTQFTIDDVWDVQRRRRFAHAFNRYDGDFTT